jgi:hypothetical protein
MVPMEHEYKLMGLAPVCRKGSRVPGHQRGVWRAICV